MKNLPKIKICGITRSEDGILATNLGAWALGFVFYPNSPRYLTMEKAGPIIDEIRKISNSAIKIVGVFVNENLQKVNDMSSQLGLDYCQLHGDESLEYISQIKSPVIKAFRTKDSFSISDIDPYTSHCSYILVDAYDKNQHGGSGKLCDWQIAANISQKSKLILAGGINSQNINDAINKVKPHGIDLSSSIEVKPGIKSKEKLSELFNQFKVEDDD